MPEIFEDSVEIDVDIKYETKDAVLVSDGDIDVWIPKSQLDDIDYKEKTILIPEWLAHDMGLI